MHNERDELGEPRCLRKYYAEFLRAYQKGRQADVPSEFLGYLEGIASDGGSKTSPEDTIKALFGLGKDDRNDTQDIGQNVPAELVAKVAEHAKKVATIVVRQWE